MYPSGERGYGPTRYLCSPEPCEYGCKSFNVRFAWGGLRQGGGPLPKPAVHDEGHDRRAGPRLTRPWFCLFSCLPCGPADEHSAPKD